MTDAVKHDKGKAGWSMLPVESMRELVRVYDIGRAKYGRDNWRKGMDYHRVFDAMMRHAWAWWSGEQRDPEDGQHHLASVAWCALTLMWYEIKGNGNDDRNESQAADVATADETIERLRSKFSTRA